MDYGIADGKRDVQVRAALAGYLLNYWNVDCLLSTTCLPSAIRWP